MNKVVAFFVCFILPIAAGAIGSIASVNAAEFYATLNRPSWSPPSWLFGPIWTTLYLMMGFAAFLVWRERGWNRLLTFFAIHLVFNALWSWIFFAWRSIGWAVVEIIALWLMITLLVVGFWRVKRLAGALLVPYWLWVAFAAALNYELWRRNPL